MRPSTILLLALSSVTFAQPTVRPRDGEDNSSSNKNDKYDWAPALERYYQAVGKHVAEIRTAAKGDSNVLSTCDLTQAVQPANPVALPAPAAGLTLAHVALGRGTQVSYTIRLVLLSEHQLMSIRITLARERHRRTRRSSLGLRRPFTMQPASPQCTRIS